MFTLSKGKTGLIIIDVQDKVFRAVDRSMEVLHAIQLLINGCKLLNLPMFVSEQYPKGLGHTVERD